MANKINNIAVNPPKNKISKYLYMKLMLAPFLIFFVLFTVIPIFSSIVLSFFEYDIVGRIRFIGLDNYTFILLKDEVFGVALKNTLIFAVITGPAGFALSFVLAWFINEFSPIVRSVLSFLCYSPALMGNAYFIWQVLFSGDSYGYINSMLMSLNLITEPIQWLKNPNYTLTIVIIVQLWMSMGVSFLANIAGLQNVNPELYEAGAIDGIKNRWFELWYITLPYMKNILLFSAVMQIASAFSVGQICITLTGHPSVNYSTETIITHLIDMGTVRYEMGVAAAISVVLFLLMTCSRIIIGKIIDSVGR